MMNRLFFLLPPAVFLLILFAAGPPENLEEAATTAQAHEKSEGRLIVIIVDSLRRATLEAEGVMPGLLALSERDHAHDLDVRTCAANFTYPCLQTLFEGRQSPFVAGLHNFTGRASQARSIPADLRAQGRHSALISNISLVSLYGGQATHVVNVEDWPISHLERDLKSFEIAGNWLADPAVDDLFIHLLGTDKAAHQDLPGTKAYEQHFRLVDQAIAEFLEGVDWSKDHVLITGDHGHDEAGHHTLDSVAILAGPRFERFFHHLPALDEIDQTELAYLMSFAAGLSLPLHYEGRYFLVERGGDFSTVSAMQAFIDRTEATLSSAGYPTANLKEAVAMHRDEASRTHQRSLLQNLPLLAGFFLWLLILEAGVSGRAPPARRWTLHLVVAASLLITSWISSPALVLSLGLTAGYAAAAGIWAWRYQGLRSAAWLLALTVMTAWISFHVKPWADFFHTRGGFIPAQPIFYAMLPTVGLILALVRDRDWRRAPEGAMAFGLFCLPSGVYYYQFGQNMFWGFLLAGVAVGLAGRFFKTRQQGFSRPSLSPKTALAASGFVLGAILVLLQEAGGWEWTYFPARWLGRMSPFAAYFIYGLLALTAAILLKRSRERWLFSVYLVVSLLFAVGVAKMELANFVAAQAVLLFVMCWFVVSGDAEAGRAAARRSALLLWAGFLAICWSMTQGFLIHNIDFHFAFAYFGHFQKDSAIFAGVFAATLLKYGLPSCAILLFYRLRAGSEAWHHTSTWLFCFAAVALFTLFVQINFAALGTTEKLFELAIAEAVVVFALVVIAAVFTALVALVDKFVTPARISGS